MSIVRRMFVTNNASNANHHTCTLGKHPLQINIWIWPPFICSNTWTFQKFSVVIHAFFNGGCYSCLFHWKRRERDHIIIFGLKISPARSLKRCWRVWDDACFCMMQNIQQFYNSLQESINSNNFLQSDLENNAFYRDCHGLTGQSSNEISDANSKDVFKRTFRSV